MGGSIFRVEKPREMSRYANSAASLMPIRPHKAGTGKSPQEAGVLTMNRAAAESLGLRSILDAETADRAAATACRAPAPAQLRRANQYSSTDDGASPRHAATTSRALQIHVGPLSHRRFQRAGPTRVNGPCVAGDPVRFSTPTESPHRSAPSRRAACAQPDGPRWTIRNPAVVSSAAATAPAGKPRAAIRPAAGSVAVSGPKAWSRLPTADVRDATVESELSRQKTASSFQRADSVCARSARRIRDGIGLES
ncbi:unnamed protein product [Lampetra planeri]